MCNSWASHSFVFTPTLLTGKFTLLENLYATVANPFSYISYLRFSAISQAPPFKTLSEAVLLAKFLLSAYAALQEKQASSNSFL